MAPTAAKERPTSGGARCVDPESAVREWLDGAAHWGPPCSDDPVSNSAVTGALVAGRAVT